MKGRFLFVLGDGNGAVKKFKTPTGMYIDSQMRLYVIEMLANRVTVLKVEDKSSP